MRDKFYALGMKKWEMIVFVVAIPVVIYFSLLSVETYIKRNYLPINKNESIDSIIRSELHTEQYAYTVLSDYLFCYYQQSGQPNESLLVPKGLHTGYRLVLHGGYSYGYKHALFNVSSNDKSSKDGFFGNVTIFEPTNDLYIFQIHLLDGKCDFSDTVGSSMHTLTFENAGEPEIVFAIHDLPKDYQLYYDDGHESGVLLNYSQIIKSIGWL